MDKIDALNSEINTGSVWAPYNEFTYTLQPGEYKPVDYVTEFFELLDTTAANSLEVNFGGAVNQTNFTTGLCYFLKRAVPKITLHNKSNSAFQVHFALGCGDVRDNRLTVAGVITTTETYTALNVSTETFPATGIIALAGGHRKIVIQNTGAQNIYIGAANGFLVSPSGSMDIPLDGTINIYGTNGETVAVGYFD